MATQQSATIYITNNTDANASIILFHNNSSHGTQSGRWNASPGQTVGPMTVYFETGGDSIPDYWSLLLHVQGGSRPGFYVSSGTDIDPYPYSKECQLADKDAGQTITLSVSASEFNVALNSGGYTAGMTKLTPSPQITHVFVVMLENHSFDNMFAMSNIPGITKASTSNSNSYTGNTYYVQSSAPISTPTDPGHEFDDVLEQLCGPNVNYPSGGPYPQIYMSGFVANYATSNTEGTGLPPPADWGDVMACFATSDQLPTLYQLATEFALCDQWYSSMPGPTWPNRFFAHGASSSGLDDSPTTEQIGKWELPCDGFKYPHGSIYDALTKAGIPYRFYSDFNPAYGPSYRLSIYSDDPNNGSWTGGVPQVSSLSGVTIFDVHSLQQFASDLQGPYPHPYTFIEPHYGDVTSNTYQGGSSQHPMDDVAGGQNLLAAVYAAIRSSNYWNTSLLIITYDEHGGLYDCVGPGGATAPGDNPQYGYNLHGFNFQQYGVRVPAIIVSPLIPAGTVSHTLCDHSSVLKTVEELFGQTSRPVGPLTQRDAGANGLSQLLCGPLREDCPMSLQTPASSLTAKPPLTAAERALIDAQPMPQSGNLVGTLGILMKTEVELSAGTPAEFVAAKAKFNAIKTRGDARAYVESVMEKVGIAERQRKLAMRGNRPR